MLTWKTRIGKNHDSPQTAEIHYESKVTTRRGTEATTSLSPSSPHAAVTVEATTSLSLSLTHSLTLSLYTHAIQQLYKSVQLYHFFALSYIYTYMTFRLFKHVSLPIGRDGSVPGLRSSGSP